MPALERIFFRHWDTEARIIFLTPLETGRFRFGRFLLIIVMQSWFLTGQVAVVLHGGKTLARMWTHTPYVSRVWRPAFAEASAGQRSSGSEPPATCSQSNVLHPALNGKMLLSKESPCREMFRFMHLLEPIT